MKLLYIANIRLPTEKAHGIQIMKMCEAFANAGAMVELVVPWRFNPITEDAFIYYGVEKNFTITKIPSLDLIAFGKIGFLLQACSFAFFAFLYALSSKHAQIIYTRDELPLFFLSFFKKNIFLETHTKKENFFALHALHRVCGVISITQGLKDFYLTKGADKEKIFVAPDGVDLRQFDIDESKKELRKHLDLPREKKIVGYIGKYKTMGVPKGVDDLIINFSDVLASLPGAFLLLVGMNNNEVEEVESVFQRERVGEEHYKIVTHVPQRKAFLYMKASDVLVMNYPDTPHYSLYMSPLKLFEYMASGVPIVTSNLSSVREILNERNACLISTDKMDSLHGGILGVLTDHSYAQKISRQARADVQRYTWDQRAKNILKFMK